MEIALSKRTVTLPEEPVRDERAVSIEWLKNRAENNGTKTKETRDIADYTDDELYAELDKCSVEKARLGRRRDQYTSHTRRYWNDRRKQVAAELRRRKLPVRKKGSRKTLATAAHHAARKRELREAMA